MSRADCAACDLAAKRAKKVRLWPATKCYWCGECVPLGPARDTAETEVEVRAAELARQQREVCAAMPNWTRTRWTDAECRGWVTHIANTADHPDHGDAPGDPESEAGWLAREMGS